MKGSFGRKEFNGYVIRWWYEGFTCYHVEKDGVEVYHGFSVGDIIDIVGANPFE